MKNVIHEIEYDEYLKKLLIATKNSNLVYLNCDVPEITKGTKYFTSNEGISYLKSDGFMGGLCRFKKGNEQLTQIHQQHRISLGGHFLDCYEGKLSEMYETQGFHKVGEIPFDISFAKKGWGNGLAHRPNVLLMSLYPKEVIKTFEYDLAYVYASSTYSYKIIKSLPLRDKFILDRPTLNSALTYLGKDERDIISITEGFRCVDYYIEKPKVIIRRTNLN